MEENASIFCDNYVRAYFFMQCGFWNIFMVEDIPICQEEWKVGWKIEAGLWVLQE